MLNLFTNKGFRYPSSDELATLSDHDRTRFEPVRVAYEVLSGLDADIAAMSAKVQADVEAIAATEAVIAKLPKPTFHDLWKQSLSKQHPGRN